MKDFKKWLPDVVAVVVFVVLSVAYFFPSDFEGRILYQHDTSAGAGAGQEAKEYFDKTGERTRWTNALFGGMPTYQLSPSYQSTDTLARWRRHTTCGCQRMCGMYLCTCWDSISC